MPLRASVLLCALAAGLVLLPAAAAAADPPTPSPTPTSTTTAPVPSATPPAPAWDPAVRFAAGAVPGTVTLSWDPAPGATGYAVVVAGRGRSTTSVPSLLLTGIAPGTDLRVRVVAETAEGAVPSSPARWTAPAAVPAVADASLVRTRVGLRLRWTPVPGVTSYLVELRGADGTDLHRTVAGGSSVTFEPLPSGTLYSALVTAVAADGRRSQARAVRSMFTATAGGPTGTATMPAVAPQPLQTVSARGSAPVAAAVQPQAPPSAAAIRPTLVDSPVAAAACAAAAVVLGALAVLGLLLRRPRKG
ncbi:fibronectin type III domain-containing protein [Amnibacterium sp. CER49]|uniref:fibronectin type III domain-containing protein n=1 Tax=Amnibacterium sp. CER49 TaxID=3039161 RepID=UPI00244AB4A2|nr:fibronectin type III domain-containing protein [Amnibacterium sp. CER49]MDH2443614.1 fibronectin type III domain-containing protein [Amnibacterium sp. CER49]